MPEEFQLNCKQTHAEEQSEFHSSLVYLPGCCPESDYDSAEVWEDDSFKRAAGSDPVRLSRSQIKKACDSVRNNLPPHV